MTSVEKPDHVDPVRMRHITDADLLATFDVHSLAELRALLERHDRPRPVWDPARWAAAGPASAPAVLKEADELLTREVDFLDRGLGRSRLYGLHYLGWLNPLIQAHALTGDSKYAECFERLFGQWYDRRDEVVGDWPGLDVIWYSLGVASRSAMFVKALAVLGPRLSEHRWAQLVKSIVGGARWAFEEHDSFRYGNWQLVSVAELLHVAAVLPEPKESASWAERAQTRLLEHVELDFYADGGHHERSPSYHTMCMEALHRAAVAGEQCLDWSLVAHERLRAMHDWLVAMSTDAGWIPHFQDSGLVWPAKLLLRGEYFYPGRGYGELARRWMSEAEMAEELSWLPPAPARAPQTVAPAEVSRLLPTSQYAILRGDGILTTVNYGPHIGHELESHSHHAALDFVIAAQGVPLAWDAGCPSSYDDPGYYDWFQATRGHNTVQPLDPELAQLSTERIVSLDTFASLPLLDVFAAHHDGYPVRHDRRIVFVRTEPGYWLVSDSLGGQGFAWRLHGRDEWLPEGDGFRAAGTPGLLVLPAEPESIPHSEHTTGPARMPDPVTRQADYATLHGLTLTIPTGRSDVLLALGRDAKIRRDGAGIVVRIGDFEDHFRGYQYSRFDSAKRLVAAARWSKGPLTHDDRVLLEAPGLTAASLSYADDRLEAVVEVTRRTTVALHAPGLTRLRLNGVSLAARAHEGNGLGMVAVEVPSAGRWRIEGERAEGERAEGAQAEGAQAEDERAEDERAEGERTEGKRAEGERAEGKRAEGERVEGAGIGGEQWS
ncbi:MAG TPA: heparinase II/III family protein [Candidatus Limnocylindrales bacterium]